MSGTPAAAQLGSLPRASGMRSYLTSAARADFRSAATLSSLIETGRIESFSPWKAHTGVLFSTSARLLGRSGKPPQTGAIAAKSSLYLASLARPHVPMPPCETPVR